MEDWRQRSAMLLGWDSIIRLERSSVAVFGLGGVGSYVAEALARGGVGRLILVDKDVVDPTNINRQLCAMTSTVGLAKAEVMAQRIQDIAPSCLVEAHTVFYRPPEGTGLIDQCDYVADAIDTVSSKLSLVQEAREKNIPIISAMGCGNKLDPTRFQVADIFDTTVCPLCRVMRRELKKRGITALRVVYSTEAPIPCAASPSQSTERPSPGSVPFVPSVAGLIMAGEIIRHLAALQEG